MANRSCRCVICGKDFEATGSGPPRKYCGSRECERERNRIRKAEYTRRFPHRHRELDASRRRYQRRYERDMANNAPRVYCGCGEDYLTVELERHICPNPVIR